MMKRHGPGGCCCEDDDDNTCLPCTDGAPNELDITIALSDNDCSNCTDLDGKYRVSYLGTTTYGCKYQYLFTSTHCTTETKILAYLNTTGISVEIWFNGTGTNKIVWSFTKSYPYDCKTLSETSSTVSVTGTCECSSTGTDCLLESV